MTSFTRMGAPADVLPHCRQPAAGAVVASFTVVSRASSWATMVLAGTERNQLR